MFTNELQSYTMRYLKKILFLNEIAIPIVNWIVSVCSTGLCVYIIYIDTELYISDYNSVNIYHEQQDSPKNNDLREDAPNFFMQNYMLKNLS